MKTLKIAYNYISDNWHVEADGKIVFASEFLITNCSCKSSTNADGAVVIEVSYHVMGWIGTKLFIS